MNERISFLTEEENSHSSEARRPLEALVAEEREALAPEGVTMSELQERVANILFLLTDAAQKLARNLPKER